MSTSRLRIAAAALALSSWAVLVPIGVANADCTGAGDFGAGAGCPPPGSSGSGNTESWPPTSVDWPPQLNADSGSANGKPGGGGDAKPTPIVLPSGQSTPPATSGSDSTSTSTSPAPIVPVGQAPRATETTSPTTTAIVAPQS